MLEPQATFDVYSFGLIMWELYHRHVPFDGNLMTATQCVIVDDVRPKIRESQFDDDLESRYKET